MTTPNKIYPDGFYKHNDPEPSPGGWVVLIILFLVLLEIIRRLV
jgi:hypothetical protein